MEIKKEFKHRTKRVEVKQVLSSKMLMSIIGGDGDENGGVIEK